MSFFVKINTTEKNRHPCRVKLLDTIKRSPPQRRVLVRPFPSVQLW